MTLRSTVATTAVLVLIVTACSDTGTTSTPVDEPTSPTTEATAGTTTTAGPVAVADPSCPGTDVEPGIEQHTVTFNGTERTYLVYVPTSYDPDMRGPVVFLFHGAGSKGEEILAYSQLQPYSDRDGIILVMPDAAPPNQTWNPGNPGDGLDLDFVAAVHGALSDRFCVNDHVYATGISNGGFMATAMACAGGVAGVAPVALSFYAAGCHNAPPVPYLYFHGTGDQIVPYAGDEANGLASAPDTAASWALHNSCEVTPDNIAVSDNVALLEWTGCAAPTEFYTIIDGGHTWPGSFDIQGLGTVTQDINASQLIWRFFFGGEA